MITTNIARTGDGTIQINFSVPRVEIDQAEEKALKELGSEITVDGFRKGKAPLEKVKDKVDQGKLLEKALGKILPEAYAKAVSDNKIKPIIYPRFEILNQGDVWEIQAKTAELPLINLPDYKSLVKKAIKTAKAEEKQNVVIRTLIESIPVKIPQVIVDEEVNGRLAQLLERTEKLGLKLENYLASIGKDEKTIREDYQKQVSEGISLELILNKIGEEEKIEILEKDIEAALTAAGVKDDHRGHQEEQKQLVRAVLKRRKALDLMTKLS